MTFRVFVFLFLLSSLAQAITPWERYSISKAVGQGTWEASEEIFRKLKETELPPEQTAQVNYNLGVSLYNQEKYEESLPLFETAAKTQGEALKAKALYNQGNALFKLERLDDAKAAFQQALLANPDDDDTRHNIEVILEKQQQDQNQQDQQDQNQQDQENESDQEQQDDQGESDEQEQEEKNQGDQNQDSDSDNQDGESQQDQQSGEQEQEQEGQQQEMTEEEKKAAQEAAERARLLDYFKQQERDGRPANRVRAQAPPVRGKTW